MLVDHGRALAANGRFDNALSRVLMGQAMNGRWTMAVLVNGLMFSRNAGHDGHALEFARRMLEDGTTASIRALGRYHRLRMGLEYHAGDQAIALLTDEEADWHVSFQRSILGCIYLSDPAYTARAQWPGLSADERYSALLSEASAGLLAHTPQVERSQHMLALLARHTHDLPARMQHLATWLQQCIDQYQQLPIQDAEAQAFARQRLHDDLRIIVDTHMSDWRPYSQLASSWLIHLSSDQPLLPLPGDYRIIPEYPMPGISWSAHGRQQLQQWWAQHHQRIVSDGQTSSPQDLDDLGSSSAPQADLNALEQSLSRGSRGWDFPPQVWRDRRARMRAEDSNED